VSEGEVEKMKKHIAMLVVLFMVYSSPGVAQVLTIEPVTTNVGNCVPFGRSTNGPYTGFIYQNIPAFSLLPGDSLAFDLAGTVPNDNPIEYDIELAPTTVNGGSEASGTFTKVVSNTQQAAVPNGDTILGNYELAFIVEAPFSFSGGGLIIRFTNPGVNFTGDASCDQVLHWGDPGDASGFFVQRFWGDTDGLFPYQGGDASTVGAFRVGVLAEPIPVPTLSEWALLTLSLLLFAWGVVASRKRLL